MEKEQRNGYDDYQQLAKLSSSTGLIFARLVNQVTVTFNSSLGLANTLLLL